MGITVEAGPVWKQESDPTGSIKFTYAGIEMIVREIKGREGQKVICGLGWMPRAIYHQGLEHSITGEGEFHAIKSEEGGDPFFRFALEPEAAIDFFVKGEPNYLSITNG